MAFEIIQASSSQDIDSARQLFREYEALLGVSLCFQNFEDELSTLPGKYAPPAGRLLLAFDDGQLIGCIALRSIDSATCEMKRLFVRPDYRGREYGRKLAEKLISEAKQIGYTRMRLDTMIGRMDPAIGLYRSLGFKEIPAYYKTPVSETIFMELTM